MGFFDSILGTKKTKRNMPEWSPKVRAVLEVSYDDLKREFGKGCKDDTFGYTFWDLCAEDLANADLIDEDDCAQISDRNPDFAGSPRERGPRKAVENQEKFYILASSSRILDAVADEISASVFQRRNI